MTEETRGLAVAVYSGRGAFSFSLLIPYQKANNRNGLLITVRDIGRRFYRQLMNLVPASGHVAIDYYRAHKHFPGLRHPRTFNEKVAWRKLYDYDSRLPALVDKVKCKNLISARYGANLVIPTIAVFDTAEHINFEMLTPPCTS